MTPSYALGLFFILCVSLIWAAASVVVQHLYRDMNFNSPFLLTYVSTSLFVLWLPFRLIWERRNRWSRTVLRLYGRLGRVVGPGLVGFIYEEMPGEDNDGGGGDRKEVSEQDEDDGVIPWRSGKSGVVGTPLSAPRSTIDGSPSALEREGPGVSTNGGGQLSAGGSIEMGQRALYQTLSGHKECTVQEQRQELTADVNGEKNDVKAGGSLPDMAMEQDEEQKGRHSDVLRSEKDKSRQVPSRISTEDSFSEHSSQLCSTHFDDKQDAIHSLLSSSFAASHPAPSSAQQTTKLLSHVDHIWMAVRIAPVWFLSNYFYNMSLAYTSITSSTVLASTGSLFTFLFAVSCGDERFTTYKLLGVVLCFTGSVLTGLSDVEGSNGNGGFNITNAQGMERFLIESADYAQPTATVEVEQSSPGASDASFDEGLVWGDVAGLISAIGYGTYTVLIRNLCPKDESCMSMTLLLGYIGTLNGLLLMPILIKMAFFDSCDQGEDSAGDSQSQTSDATSGSFLSCENLTWIIVLYLVGKALADNVLSDYLWARAVVLTSATVATVGLGLTIPLAFLSDWLMGRADVTSTQSVLGALSVLMGFLFVNCGEGSNDVVEYEEDVQVDQGVMLAGGEGGTDQT